MICEERYSTEHVQKHLNIEFLILYKISTRPASELKSWLAHAVTLRYCKFEHCCRNPAFFRIMTRSYPCPTPVSTIEREELDNGALLRQVEVFIRPSFWRILHADGYLRKVDSTSIYCQLVFLSGNKQFNRHLSVAGQISSAREEWWR